MKIVFLVGHYYPTPMANGVCVEKIAHEFFKHNYEVHVISFGNKADNTTIYNNGTTIHRINQSLYRRIHSKQKHDRFYLFRKILLFTIKAFLFFAYPLTSFAEVRRYVKECGKIVNQNERCIIVCTFNPLEATVAGMKLMKKYKTCFFVNYFLDTLSNEGGSGTLNAKTRFRKGLRWENKIFNAFSLNLILKCHESYYDSNLFGRYCSKIRFIDVPLYSDIQNEVDTIPRTITYAGALSKKTRNPEYACRLLPLLYPGYSIDFYGRGDCDDIIERYSNLTNNQIKKILYLPHDEMIQKISSSEILLSIGNNNSSMVPSKIFEYISTGKKIIHFFYTSSDPSIQYLEKYNNAILVDMSLSLEENLKILKNNPLLFDERTINKSAFFENDPLYTFEIIANGFCNS